MLCLKKTLILNFHFNWHIKPRNILYWLPSNNLCYRYNLCLCIKSLQSSRKGLSLQQAEDKILNQKQGKIIYQSFTSTKYYHIPQEAIKHFTLQLFSSARQPNLVAALFPASHNELEEKTPIRTQFFKIVFMVSDQLILICLILPHQDNARKTRILTADIVQCLPFSKLI